jgi:biopolymer transport protein ExbB
MKRIIPAFLIILLAFFATTNVVTAQEDPDTTEVAVDDSAAMAEAAAAEEAARAAEEEKAKAEAEAAAAVDADMPTEDAEPEGFHKVLRKKFIEGDAVFMSFVLICLILGLAFAIERIITINLASANTKKLMGDIDNALKAGDTEQAKELCRSTPGPVASVIYQGLDRKDEGINMVEKSIEAYGSVQMGLLEKGLVWISLFISLAPMLGFMGTVIGMIGAFDAIESAGDINPSLVAGGIKMALITTIFGLIVAIILQVFYNYIVSKIDDIVNNMEDASVSFVDMMIKYNVTK